MELLVVVALVGILASIATSKYRTFTAKARQAEAKLGLGGMYMAEYVFRSEHRSFTMCLKQAGYSALGLPTRYYSMGFMAPATNECGPDGNVHCAAFSYDPPIICDWSCTGFDAASNDTTYQATAKVSDEAVIINTCANQGVADLPNAWAAFRDSYIVGAGGNIIDENKYDLWQIDQTKRILNIRPGL